MGTGEMRFQATDVFDLYKPAECVRRVALLARGVEQQVTDSAFRDLLRNLGLRHEAGHLRTLPGIVDLTASSPADRERLTLEAIRSGAAAIYQPRFRLELLLDGERGELVGEPDFLIRDDARGGYLIRDSKLAHNPLSDRHAGIPLQLQIYGYLYERATGEAPLSLEVHAGTGEIVPIPYGGGAAVLELLRAHRRMRARDPADYEPVGWTKCGGCGYEDRCWSQAEAASDVALLTRVSQVRARELHRLGITTIAQIAPATRDPAFHDYFWTGKKAPRLRDFVAPLLLSAQALMENREIRLEEAPALPDTPHVAMLDLEGLPPYVDDLDRIYLWGVKVYGEQPSAYLPAQSGFGPDGDREGWFAFLRTARDLFTRYGPELPFVHWSSYERTKLTLYLERYGDLQGGRPQGPPLHASDRVNVSANTSRPDLVGAGLAPALGDNPLDGRFEGGRPQGPPLRHVGESSSGVATRVLANLVDLLSVLRKSVVLPLPSYSLKAVDAYVGFRRRLPEANGAWSIAKYIEATESNDPGAREALVNQILAYNEEDLDATRAVMEWLRARGSSASP